MVIHGNDTLHATPLLQDEAFVIDDELYAIGGAVGGSTEVDGAICDSTAAISDAIGDSTAAISDAIGNSTAGGTSGCADEAIYEAQADIDNIVRTLFSAWLQFPPRRSREPERAKFEFLGPRALHAISTAWRRIKAERDVLPEPEVIVQGLAESMVDYIYPRNLKVPEVVEDAIKEAFTIHVTKVVKDGWQQILDGIEEDARKKRERRRRMRERLRRSQEVAEVLRFYAPFARINNSVHWDCRLLCLFLCECCSIFIFQVPIHTLLLGWPISIGVMGGLYMTQCPMSHLMPYVMMALGAVGTVALLMRLSFVIYKKFSENEISSMWPWIVLKLIEFTFLDILIIQLFYFFSETPTFIPGSPKYCNETFYSFVHWINYVSIALVSVWMFVYFTKGLLWLRSRKFDYGYR
ncbi:hypothetical protein AVEN_1682-1 [Araneus ventricosus]|uniref:Uncharacterized protein n=1 Tax=Araneus ventricosus TaxID=182803 RepID=A0A4Y2RNY9_ARAVE|nr:hypothetical protein AVEN_1682-1 [Araneus ventricosus]